MCSEHSFKEVAAVKQHTLVQRQFLNQVLPTYLQFDVRQNALFERLIKAQQPTQPSDLLMNNNV